MKSFPQPEPLTSAKREELEQVEGLIFDIQRYSLHDGPGLRTNVFFSGCPLRCGWCSNPESQHLAPELALFAHQCIACGQFSEPCPQKWARDRQGDWTTEIEEKYSERVQKCPTGAIRWIGAWRAAGEVMREVMRDAPFYEDGGGMTLTGGEATMQPQMAEAVLRLAKAEYISTAIETCGHVQWPVFERLLPYLDLLLFDLKHVDSDRHRRCTGVGNERILDNLQRLVAINAPLTLRIPLIPGFNASEQSIREIMEYLTRLNGAISHIDVLPYHTLGKAKYQALGREYPWERYQRLTDAEVETLVRLIESYGLSVTIGG